MYHIIARRIAIESIEQTRGNVYGDDKSSAAVEILRYQLERRGHRAVESAAEYSVDDNCVRCGLGEGERRFAGHLVQGVRGLARGQAVAHQLTFRGQAIASDIEEKYLGSVSARGQ